MTPAIAATPRVDLRRRQFRWSSAFFTGLTGAATLFLLARPGVDPWQRALSQGLPRFSWRFLSGGTERDIFSVKDAGIMPMIFGTAARVIIMTIFVLPVGVITAIYLTGVCGSRLVGDAVHPRRGQQFGGRPIHRVRVVRPRLFHQLCRGGTWI